MGASCPTAGHCGLCRYLSAPSVLLVSPSSVPVSEWHASLLQHKVTKFPKIEMSQARHAPGYIRGELGGMFTS